MKTIITAGKGGTGKTTILYYLLQRHILHRPERMLIVDADPHQSLSYLLGMRDARTLGKLRHEQDAALRTGAGLDETTSRREFAQQLAQCALHSLGPNADLLVMGRNDQPGCQCVVNGLLGDALDALAEQYDMVIVDNEAGIEHIGRHGWAVDVALLTTGMNSMEIDVARQIMWHATQTNRSVHAWGVIINHRIGDPEWANQILSLINNPDATFLGSLPFIGGAVPSSEWFAQLELIWRRIAYLMGLWDYVPAMVSRSQPSN
jgi:CO dehydrogenase maturation factor